MKAHYDRVTWLFVTRNFGDDAKDREASRTHDRFGISTWPQLVLFDPRDDAVLAFLPRGFEACVKVLEQFPDAVPKPTALVAGAIAELQRARALAATDPKAAAKVAKELAAEPDEAGVWLGARELLRGLQPDRRTLAQRLADPDVRERALAIEAIRDGGKDAAGAWRAPTAARLFDPAEHIVVRIRALAWLVEHEPKAITARAPELLAVPSDAFRNLVLGVVAEHPDPKLGPTLAAMFAGAGQTVPSRNPNVLRGNLARCLPGSGDAAAIDAVAPLVREANPRNGTTGQVATALGELAPRLAAADRERLVALLLEGLPAANGENATDVDRRSSFALATKVHDALCAAAGRKLPKPEPAWGAAERERYLAAVQKALGR